MKNLTYLILPLLVLFTACSPGINVSTDYDIATNFRQFKTYGWYQEKPNAKAKTDSLGYDTFFDKRMKKAIETQLRTQGLTHAESNPDVYVNYRAGVSNQQRVQNNFPYGYGYRYGYPFGGTSVQQYKEGTITIDMVDAKKNELLWRGVGEMELSNRNISEEKVYEAVRNILRQYPPKGDR
jgi:hypothetical protein